MLKLTESIPTSINTYTLNNTIVITVIEWSTDIYYI